MKADKYGQIVLTEDDLCNLFMDNPDIKIVNGLTETMIEFDPNLELDYIPALSKYEEITSSLEEFDSKCQSNWFMPKEYQEMDIAKWLLDQCKTEAELQRVGEELIMFQERDMFMLLKYLKYLVDTMRKNNVVWGVCRGSSVASYVLFLLNVHRINSLHYDLSIEEFLK